jgi:uncharacterized protein (TIGR03435 family)|nr:TIGR03435 family protein [Candidatus Acidoferrales bacterium]
MTLTDLSPLANHLWQSTLFAIAAWLLALVLRKNRASVRYWIWFAASVKFLIPFSLLVSIGNRFAWHSAPIVTQPQFANAINQIGQPFATFTETSSATPLPHASSAVPLILLATWLTGAIVALIVWLRSLRQIRAIKRSATPLPLGLSIPVLSSAARMEPGIFGIFKPVLLLPEGIAGRLTPAQFKAVLAHEMCHVQRRDNLTAAIHMVVETVFWFHPFVWWIRTQLVAERERACDEAVIRIAEDPQVYAEAILNVCKLYIESPLRCVSGVSGSDLKRRIRAIVAGRVGGEMTLARKAVLSIAAIVTLAMPIFAGVISAQISRARYAAPGHAQSQSKNDDTTANTAGFAYDVVSVKPWKPGGGGRGGAMLSPPETPDGFIDGHATLRDLVQLAFGTHHFQVQGAPSWYDSAAYEIDAKMDGSKVDALQKLSPHDRILARQHMLQVLLADRFKLTFHHETKEVPVYFLVVARNGTGLQETKPGEVMPAFDSPDGTKFPAGVTDLRNTDDNGKRTLIGVGIPIVELVEIMTYDTGDDRPILDKTGLTGKYNFTVRWFSPDDPPPVQRLSDMSVEERQAELRRRLINPAQLAAIQKQLGLKLEPGKGPVDYIVIDHVERPSEN